MTKKIIIDCDPGIDDAVAILVALGHPGLAVQAVTTTPGNVPARIGARNARRVLELADRADVPVAEGAAAPLTGQLPADPFSHGGDGLADAGLPAPRTPVDPRSATEVILALADELGPDLSIVAIGPMTNLALAAREDPSLPRKVGSVSAIAGMFHLNEYGPRYATGDNPASEWNTYVDPVAAREVIAAGFDLTLIGLDISTHPGNTLDEDALRRLAASDSPAVRFTKATVDFVLARGFQSYCSLIDPLAVVHMAQPDLFETARLRVAVETAGEWTRGATIVDRRAHFTRTDIPLTAVVTAVDHRAALEVILDSLETPATRLDLVHGDVGAVEAGPRGTGQRGTVR